MNLRLTAATAALATLALAGCATTSPNYGNSGYNNGYGAAPAACYDCGTVTRIDTGNGSRVPNATGAVLGGIVGAAATREVAKDRTNSSAQANRAAVAGAAAGALVGNAIQNRAGMGYNIYVQMNDGSQQVVSQDDLGGIQVGSRVRLSKGHAYLQ